MDNIQDAINSLEISLIRNADEIMTDCFSRKTLKTAIKALERQTFFENEVDNIHGWFVDNKDELLSSAMSICNSWFDDTNVDEKMDKIDIHFMIEDVVDRIQEGILNVLSSYIDGENNENI